MQSLNLPTIKISRQSDLAKKMIAASDRQKQPRYTDQSDKNIFNQTLEEAEKILKSKYSDAVLQQKLEMLDKVKAKFYKNEIRHYNVMGSIPEQILKINNETTKQDWIDQQFNSLAKELIYNYVLKDELDSKDSTPKTKKEQNVYETEKKEHFSTEVYKQRDFQLRTRRRSIMVQQLFDSDSKNSSHFEESKTASSNSRFGEKVNDIDDRHRRLLSFERKSNHVFAQNYALSAKDLDKKSTGQSSRRISFRSVNSNNRLSIGAIVQRSQQKPGSQRDVFEYKQTESQYKVPLNITEAPQKRQVNKMKSMPF